MAQRGSPLPFAIREAIKRLRADKTPVREVAVAVGVSKNTVSKYARSLGQTDSTARRIG